MTALALTHQRNAVSNACGCFFRDLEREMTSHGEKSAVQCPQTPRQGARWCGIFKGFGAAKPVVTLTPCSMGHSAGSWQYMDFHNIQRRGMEVGKGRRFDRWNCPERW